MKFIYAYSKVISSHVNIELYYNCYHLAENGSMETKLSNL